MTDRKRLCAAALLFALLFALAGCAKRPVRVLPLTDGDIRVFETTEDGLSTRSYEDANGIRLDMMRLTHGGVENTYCFYSETVPEGSVLRVYDAVSEGWTTAPVTAGTYTTSCAVLELPDGETRFFFLPVTYLAHGHDVLEQQTSLPGSLDVRQSDGGFAITVNGQTDADSFCTDFTMVTAPMLLLDWNSDNWASVWGRYTDDGEAKWCYTGYYRFTSDNYDPTGDNCYYRCPATFLAREIRWQLGKSVAAPLVTLAMLDTVMQTQNAAGYFPTMPKSGWLSADYGIGYDFYDTRFNTDLMDAVLEARAQLDGKLFQRELERYAAFYTEFANAHHTETENGGWLVADYWSADMTAEPHTSLNHQLAECLLLYRLQDDSGIGAYGELADKLLQAVDDTAPDWVKDDHDLHYCRYADGSYGAKDYPDLTQKDLVALRRYLIRERYRTDTALDELIREKRIWMDANGISY
ncbi:MAG: hypothetical protein IJT18_03030 [Oscillospiraceae bacterium]|nr:hypothetical protein [Oscillospiraceae bacterium]